MLFGIVKTVYSRNKLLVCVFKIVKTVLRRDRVCVCVCVLKKRFQGEIGCVCACSGLKERFSS